MAILGRKKKVPVRETDDKNSILQSLQETPVNDTIQVKKKQVIMRSHMESAIFRIVAFVCLVAFVFTFIFGIKTIESNDMYPAVRAGDMIIYYRLMKAKRTDVVLFKTDRKPNIGRIQAAEDDVVGITNAGQITINGDIQPVIPRQGVFYKTYQRENAIKYPIKIKKREYFILGDERESAKDSRIYGPIKDEDVIGKVFTIIRRRAI